MGKYFGGFAAFDFDGTLFSPRHGIPEKNMRILGTLGERDICRAVVTGRSLFSFNRVVPPDFPVDYLIFSSGAGIMDWKTKEILLASRLEERDIRKILPVLEKNRFDFMIHQIIPENHNFFYCRQNPDNRDFNTRVEAHYAAARELNEHNLPRQACQFVAILPPGEIFPQTIMAELKGYSVIRATSPLDDQSTWMEVFPPGVNKGSGIRWLLKHLGIKDYPSMGVGNDYNDLDMLETVESPFVMAGSPAALMERFPAVGSCEDAGAAGAAEIWFGRNWGLLG